MPDEARKAGSQPSKSNQIRYFATLSTSLGKAFLDFLEVFTLHLTELLR